MTDLPGDDGDAGGCGADTSDEGAGGAAGAAGAAGADTRSGDVTRDARRRRSRLVDQFAGRGDRADIWRCLDLVVDTDAYLNLGYAGRYRPYPVGNPQRRLVERLGSALAPSLSGVDGPRVVDVGCGRGGPASLLAERLDADVTGVDVVAPGLATARENAADAGVGPSFVAGDAVALPFVDGAFDACTAIDAIVYVPEKRAVFAELARVTRPGGHVVVSDLLVADGAPDRARRRVDAFADAWDMPPIPTLERYRQTADQAGLTVASVEDVSPHSIDRFRKWSALALLLDDLGGGLVERALGRRDLDAETMTEQVRLAHAAIPHLQHVIVRARIR